MKKTLTLGTVLLGCCLAAAAQMGSNPNQTPPANSTPSTFPQDQTGQTPSNPSAPTNPSSLPPDAKAPGSMASDQSQAAPQTSTLQGCLSQSADGNFMLADSSGNSFQLHGNSSQLSSNIGKEVKVEGIAAPDHVGAMSSQASEASGMSAARQISVSSVQKVAETCAATRKY